MGIKRVMFSDKSEAVITDEKDLAVVKISFSDKRHNPFEIHLTSEEAMKLATENNARQITRRGRKAGAAGRRQAAPAA